MPVPSSTVLRAAARWLEHRRESSDAQLRALFRAHPAFADITPTQYTTAYEWLQARGLLKASPTTDDCVHVVFEAAIREALWFRDSDLLVPEPNSMPQDGMFAAEALGIEPSEAFAIVHSCWGKVDTAERERIGAAGEYALISLLQSVPDVQVRHVAAVSDGYGYDIHAALLDATLHIEVKTTTRRGRLLIFLSRNEFEAMRRDPDWLLVALRVSDAMRPIATATVDRNWIAMSAPEDQPGGRWESARLDIPHHAITPGIAPIYTRSTFRAPAILQGEPTWPGA
ncbi:MAG: DUF3883 domain-containing protein [Mycolicibacterium sp.]|nr:DUF3883 domain-containing protein [Mycolicibacterium insubricum]MCB9440306.1 DUF3883 domain-containing protein [Mycolicibacterium sp.]MCV7081580.1 DUF3883 domain-containing protein [Mycolicibacterium insubricum]